MLLSALHKVKISGAYLILVHLPGPDLIGQTDNKSQREEMVNKRKNRWNYFFNGDHNEELKLLYPEYVFLSLDNDILHVHNFEISKFGTIISDGIILLADIKSKYYNVINNQRIVLEKPTFYNRKVSVFGNCLAACPFVEDRDTLSNILQIKLNNDYGNIAVDNPSNWSDLTKSTRQMLSPRYSFKPGDILILVTHSPIHIEALNKILSVFEDKEFFSYINLSSCFQRPHNYGEIFIDTYQLGPNGYRLLPDAIYPYLKNIIDRTESKALSDAIAQEVVDYLNSYGVKKVNYRSAGSIVMNCNPFTRGHMYLVEKALDYVDFLYIFVVSEDKSLFSFSDRYKMTYDNLSHMPNVRVLPSGSYIISQSTLPEYFDKENIQDLEIDFSHDIITFAKYIAPHLGITYRFAGSEPICKVTSAYNMAMSELLPKYGIQFIEINRKTIDGNIPISASAVRRLIKSNNEAELKKYVTPITYDYIKKKGLIVGEVIS